MGKRKPASWNKKKIVYSKLSNAQQILRIEECWKTPFNIKGDEKKRNFFLWWIKTFYVTRFFLSRFVDLLVVNDLKWVNCAKIYFEMVNACFYNKVIYVHLKSLESFLKILKIDDKLFTFRGHFYITSYENFGFSPPPPCNI